MFLMNRKLQTVGQKSKNCNCSNKNSSYPNQGTFKSQLVTDPKKLKEAIDKIRNDKLIKNSIKNKELSKFKINTEKSSVWGDSIRR